MQRFVQTFPNAVIVCMEIATSINLEQSVAIVCSSEQNNFPIPLAELGSRGLPKAEGKSEICSFDFQDFKPASFEEYLNAFGIPLTTETKHSTWSVTYDGVRYVIPILVLIRALANPHKFLLSRIFQPQSIDDICTYSGNSGKAEVRLSERFGRHNLKYFQTSIEVLSWVYCFPSARRAWASVFHSAKKGDIHLELPLATATVKLRGVNIGGSSFVTSLVFNDLHCHELPFDFACSHPPRITRLLGNYGHRKTIPDPNYRKLTQAEWEQVSRALDSVTWTTRPGKHDRATVDAVLLRLTSKVTWKSAAEMSNISADHARSTFRRWQIDGRLNRIKEWLSELSANSGKAEKGNHFSTKAVLESEYRELSQLEWDAIKVILGPRNGKGVPSQNYRKILDCLWLRQSGRTSLKEAAKMHNIKYQLISKILRRWRADGRFDRVMKELRSIGSAENVDSKLSDKQWRAISRLVTPLHVDPYQNNRSIFNCVMKKISTRISWQIAAHRDGISLGKIRAIHRLWSKDGRFEQAVTQLLDMRSPADTSSEGLDEGRPSRTI